MYERNPFFRRWRRFCAALVLLAAALRLCSSPTVTAAVRKTAQTLEQSPAFASWMLYLEFGSAVQVAVPTEAPEETAQETAPPSEPTVPTNAPTEPQVPAEPSASLQAISFTADVSDRIQIVGNCTYAVDKAALLHQPLNADFSGDGPKVLIVHTHATEAYTPDAEHTYTGGNYHTTDTACNVVHVGEEMAQVLTEHGISVLHDTTLNDAAGYNDAYERMNERISDYLARYPSIEMVIDVHRDAFEAADGSAAGSVIEVDGVESAQLMLVVDTDEAGLYHPDWRENLSCALKVQALLEETTPGLCRDLSLRTARYNQQQTPCSMLVEVGAAGNTLPQALEAARSFAEAVSALILQGT